MNLQIRRALIPWWRVFGLLLLLISALGGSIRSDARLVNFPVYEYVTEDDLLSDSSYLLPEMIITAPRIVDGEDSSYHQYRVFFHSVWQRLSRMAGLMIIGIMSLIWIILTISRVPFLHRVRTQKKLRHSYLYRTRTTLDRKR